MERGGPTLQGGSRFQNSVTALYLGRLIDGAPRPRAARVTGVRPEAPQIVDDIVVTFADGHREAIHAKDSLARGSAPWKALWRSLLEASRQLYDPRDRLVVALGTAESWSDEISEMSRRASSSRDAAEWLGRLTKAQHAFVRDVADLVSATESELRTLFARLELAVYQFDDASLARWIPRSSVARETLFALLRDRVSLHGRTRLEFDASSLLDSLLHVDRVHVHSDGDHTPRYRDQLATRTGTIEVPGTPLCGSTQELFLMPRAFLVRDPRADTEDAPVSSVTEFVDLSAFPRTEPRVVVIAGAGFGKTTLLRGITASLLQSPSCVPALLSLSTFAESKLPLARYLMHYTDTEYGCTIDWEPYLENGRAVLLLDGMDEVVVDRPWVLEQIHDITGAYPRVAWILTTRDAASGGLPGNAEHVALAPLDADEITHFVNRYARDGGADAKDAIFERSSRDPEFRRLISVPLFLGMLLATGATSTTRAQLLERYVVLALQPASHRRLVLVNDYDVLRIAVEALALKVLERGGVDDVEASKLIRTEAPVSRPMTVLDDLVRAGILHRRATSRPFALPTVQEYLAGSALARSDDSTDTTDVRTRPWSQAVQFALELLPDATSMAERLLERPPDAFQTHLRVVARSIVNGAIVQRALKERIGTALASWWLAAPSRTHIEEAADLLARGWKENPPASVLAAARGEHRPRHGLDEIVAAVARGDVTLACLRTLITHKPYHYHLLVLQPAIDMVAADAMELYLKTARSARDSKQAEAIAVLIGNLSDDFSASAEHHLNDEGMPPIVRLALALRECPIPRDVVDPLVRAVARATEQLPFMVNRALARLGWPVELVRELASQLPHNGIDAIAHAIKDDEVLTVDHKRRLLEAMCAVVPSSLRAAAKIVLADLGDDTTITELLEGWNQLNEQQQTYFAASLARQERVEALRGLLRRAQNADAAALASLLPFAVQYQITLHSSGAVSGATRDVAHPMHDEIAEWLWNHARACTTVDLRRTLLSLGAELGHIESSHAFRDEIASVLREDAHLPDDVSLMVLEDCGLELELSELLRAATQRDTPSNNAAAMRAIERHGTRDALEMLIHLQRDELDPFVSETLEMSVERLATQLGVPVERDAVGRLRAAAE